MAKYLDYDGLGKVWARIKNYFGPKYATCSTGRNTAAKVVSYTGFVLQTGARITVKFTDTGTSNPASGNITLNVNSTGAKNVYLGRVQTALTQMNNGHGAFFYNNQIIDFVYDGTNWIMIGGFDTNTTYSAGTGISLSGTTFSNSGVRSITQDTSDGHKLTINTGGTSSTITIPDNNTWRGIQNNLTSTSTTDSLSAAQGKALNDKFGSYLPLAGGTMTGAITTTDSGNAFVWKPNTNFNLTPSANGQEWSFDLRPGSFTGTYWQVWDETKGTLLKVDADSGKVSAPKGFSGNLSGNASTATKATQDGDGNTISSTYLKLSGGTMNTGATVTFPYSSGSRKVEIDGCDLRTYGAASGSWANAFGIKTNNGTSAAIYFGALGEANAIKYGYIGSSYAKPEVKIIDGTGIGVTGSLRVGAAKTTEAPMTGGCNMSYNTTTQCLEFSF